MSTDQTSQELHPAIGPLIIPPGGAELTEEQQQAAEEAAASHVVGQATRFVNVDVTPNDKPQNEPSVACSPDNPNVCIATANDYRVTNDSLIGVYRSTDGGLTWSNTVLPPPPGLTAAGDGMVAPLECGRFIIGGLAFNRPSDDGTIFVYRSTDDGRTFSSPLVIAPGNGTILFNDKPYTTTDLVKGSRFKGSVYVAYTRFIANETLTEMAFQYSRDRGRTWSPPIILSLLGESVLGASIAVGPRGEVYVSWIRFLAGNTGRFVLRRSTDGGQTFGPEITVANIVVPPSPLPVTGWAFRTPTFSFLGADTSRSEFRGTLYAVWQDFRSGSSHILLSRSTDRGRTWSAPVQIDDSPAGSQNFFPWITVDRKTGEVSVVYYTNRLSPPPGVLLDCFVAQSRDGGRTWVNRRVSTTSFNPNADPFFGVPSTFFGDYIGAWADHGRLIAVWCDTRTGSQDIFAGVSEPRPS